ncbi:S8 family serine peptidase [Klebsiella aerogenes]|nr:S8 family serine peptidase [Klebsiella aerogenes]
MTSKIKIYRMLNEKPSIYVEIIDLSGPVDLELYLGSKLIETAYNKHSNYTFEIKDSGVYSVTAKSHDSLQLNSNSLRFLMENFQPNLSFKSLEESRPINFSVDEPEIDNINKFYIEVKVTKNRIKMVEKVLQESTELNLFQRKSLNLNSFQENHSIHNYEYYITSNSLSKEDAKNIYKKIRDIEGIVYCSLVPVTDTLLPPELSTMVKSKKKLERVYNTPDFSELQGYLDEPHGMNVRNAWSNGYSGELVAIRHLDFGIYKNHEEFQDGNITVVNSRDETDDCNHGTASAGCIAAGNNDFGVTGIAYSSSFYFYDIEDKDKILEQVNPGDIVSLNVEFSSKDVYIPAIGIKSWWDTIHNIIEKGAIVIMAAGNSGVDLSDTSICPDFGDSGAILVGACTSSTGRRLSFSNYGHYSSLINSWGENVTTTGYSSLQDLPGHDRDYTNTFNGTSSATPLCSGALALLQCYAKKQGVILTAESMKQLLNESDYTESVEDLIGKRPNIEQLFTCIDKTILSPINQENPFPVSSNYINYNAFFSFNSDSEVKINFDYRFSDIINTGVVTYYSSEGPVELEWYSYGYSCVKIPVSDEDGRISIVYMRVSKVINPSIFTMNSSADIQGQSPGQFDLVLKFMKEDNKFLHENKYKGVLPLYIKSFDFEDYNLPVRLNIFID